MQSIIQTNFSLSGFFGKIRTIDIRTIDQTIGESVDKTELNPSSTKFRTSLFGKVKKSKPMNKMNTDVPTQIPVMSIPEPPKQELSKGEQRRQDILQLPVIQIKKMDQDEHRENPPGFGDFFRIDDSDIQFGNERRSTTILSNIDNSNYDSDDYEKTVCGDLHPKKWMTFIPDIVTTMEDMETTNFSPLIENYTKLLTSIRKRMRTSCVNNNWNGNVCYISNVIVPPGRDVIIRFIDDICRYIEFYRAQPFIIASEHDDHVHIAYACHQANQTCRCAWLQRCADFRKYRRKHIRRRIYTCNLGGSDWQAIMRYFCSNRRVAKKVRLPGANEGLYHKIRNFSSSESSIYSLSVNNLPIGSAISIQQQKQPSTLFTFLISMRYHL